MALLLLILLGLSGAVSLLPFLFPGTVVSMFGAALNQWIAKSFVMPLGIGHGSLVVPAQGGSILTLTGVVAFYAPPMVLLLLFLRGR
jgi:hypothetical protein